VIAWFLLPSGFAGGLLGLICNRHKRMDNFMMILEEFF
jgi:hypothetical protein